MIMVAITRYLLIHPCMFKIIDFSTVPPGQPRALSIQNISATWVRLRWEPLLEVDFHISYYELMVATGVWSTK